MRDVGVRERFPGVFQTDDGRLLTRNLVPGFRVTDEDLLHLGRDEFRSWNPQRSKLAAFILKGAQRLGVQPGGRLLYLGAANGQTASHASDILGPQGLLYGVEFSPRSFRDFVQVCEARSTMLPILADAAQPQRYQRLVGPVDTIYQDIAQRDQGGILIKNAAAFPSARLGLLMLKARSVDVAADPRQVYDNVIAQVQEAGHKLLERVDLGPFERDHAGLLFELAGR